jgi:hypothetical protein
MSDSATSAPTEFLHSARPARLSLLACGVFEGELAMRLHQHRHIVHWRQFAIGLHDHPDTLCQTLQHEIDLLSSRTDIEAIALLYGLCGCGTVGLRARRHRLVVPRAHDCITVFLGSKEAYAQHQRACPSCFYYTPGWNRARRVPGPEQVEALRTALAKRFETDDVEYLLATQREQWARHDRATFIDLGTEDADREADYARRCADWLGWRFERIQGQAALLDDLLAGNWGDAERFQVVEPGEQLLHSPDANIMKARA